MDNLVTRASYIIPVWEMKADKIERYRKTVLDALTIRAHHVTGQQNFSIRELKASDLGLRCWRTPPQKLGEKTLWINQTIRDYQFVGIYKLTQLSRNGKVSGVTIQIGQTGAATLGLHAIDQLYATAPILKAIAAYKDQAWLYETFGNLENIRMEGYFSMPFVFSTFDTVHISVDSFEDNRKGDRLVLGGFVVEVTGLTLA